MSREEMMFSNGSLNRFFAKCFSPPPTRLSLFIIKLFGSREIGRDLLTRNDSAQERSEFYARFRRNIRDKTVTFIVYAAIKSAIFRPCNLRPCVSRTGRQPATERFPPLTEKTVSTGPTCSRPPRNGRTRLFLTAESRPRRIAKKTARRQVIKRVPDCVCCSRDTDSCKGTRG